MNNGSGVFSIVAVFLVTNEKYMNSMECQMLALFFFE